MRERVETATRVAKTKLSEEQLVRVQREHSGSTEGQSSDEDSSTFIGAAGEAGSRGDRGSPGVRGAQGAAGLRGLRGQVGPTGPQGAKGPTGAKGAGGVTGAPGAMGLHGERGKLIGCHNIEKIISQNSAC